MKILCTYFSEPTKKKNKQQHKSDKQIRLPRRSVFVVRGTVNRPSREFKKRKTMKNAQTKKCKRNGEGGNFK